MRAEHEAKTSKAVVKSKYSLYIYMTGLRGRRWLCQRLQKLKLEKKKTQKKQISHPHPDFRTHRCFYNLLSKTLSAKSDHPHLDTVHKISFMFPQTRLTFQVNPRCNTPNDVTFQNNHFNTLITLRRAETCNANQFHMIMCFHWKYWLTYTVANDGECESSNTFSDFQSLTHRCRKQ